MTHPIERGQLWRQNKDETLVLIRDASDGMVVWRTMEENRAQRRTYELPEATFRARFTHTPHNEELDAIWRRLADEGENDLAVSLEGHLQNIAEEYETTLGELRDLARQWLAN